MRGPELAIWIQGIESRAEFFSKGSVEANLKVVIEVVVVDDVIDLQPTGDRDKFPTILPPVGHVLNTVVTPLLDEALQVFPGMACDSRIGVVVFEQVGLQLIPISLDVTRQNVNKVNYAM